MRALSSSASHSCEIVAHPHLAERGIFLETRLPGRDEPARVVGAGFQFAHDGPQAPDVVPALGEHTDAILRELGYDDREIAQLRTSGTL